MKNLEEKFELLKLRALLCIFKTGTRECSVTEIARTLNREKYVISRAVAALEKEGYVCRSSGKKPMLTERGDCAAKRYEERLRVSLEHLLYEGVCMESAKQDALLLSRYCTEQTMETIRTSENLYRAKQELRGRKHFTGAAVCKLLRDGYYSVPFVIYREQVKDGSNLSQANSGFEHPCVLAIENGVGTIHLRAVRSVLYVQEEEAALAEKIHTLWYFDMGRFIAAESSGGVFSFPAEVLRFLNFGEGVGQILHGSACLQMQCPQDKTQGKQVIFTMFL